MSLGVLLRALGGAMVWEGMAENQDRPGKEEAGYGAGSVWACFSTHKIREPELWGKR